MLRQLRPLVLASAAAALVAGCSATKLVHSWTLQGFNKDTVKKVLVLGIAPNPSVRRTYEDTFSVELEKLKYQAVSGYLWAPDASNLDRDAILARMKAENVTHVIVTRIVSNKEVATYHAPTVVGVGYGPGYYGSWSTYYAVGYSAYATPGYTTVDNLVTLETNFYDASKEKDALVWSGASETWTDGRESGAKINSVIHAIVYDMRTKRVL